MRTLFLADLGRMDYPTALSLQERLLELKQRQGSADILLLVEHPHVFTLGRSGKESNILSPGDVPVLRTSRGGDVTYHGPGQLVAYPILDLNSTLRKDVHRYLRNLELATIDTLASFGLVAERKPPWTGVWIDNRKIASIGVAVRRRLTYHGVALNVNTDLSYFNRIVPCGLSWAEVTSMVRELRIEQSMERVKESFVDHFAEVFGYSDIKPIVNIFDLQAGQKGARDEAR
jgi:lipoate-protein ligase B